MGREAVEEDPRMGLRLAELERRHIDRRRARVPVRYGPEKPQHLGYTSDCGVKGLFLQGNQLFPPDTELRLELDLPEGPRTVRGIVRWVKDVPPAFRRSTRGGMGIEILSDP